MACIELTPLANAGTLRAKSLPAPKRTHSAQHHTMPPNKAFWSGKKRARTPSPISVHEKRVQQERSLLVPNDAASIRSWSSESEIEDGGNDEDIENGEVDEQEEHAGLDIQMLLDGEITDFSPSQRKQICRWMKINNVRGVLGHIAAFDQLLEDLGFLHHEYDAKLKQLLRQKTYTRITAWFRSMKTVGAVKVTNEGIKGLEVVEYAAWTDSWLDPDWNGKYGEPCLWAIQGPAIPDRLDENGLEVFVVESPGRENWRVAEAQAAELRSRHESEHSEEVESNAPASRGQPMLKATNTRLLPVGVLTSSDLGTADSSQIFDSGEETLGELDTDTDSEEEDTDMYEAPVAAIAAGEIEDDMSIDLEAEFEEGEEDYLDRPEEAEAEDEAEDEEYSDIAEVDDSPEIKDDPAPATSLVIPTPTTSPYLPSPERPRAVSDSTSQTLMQHHRGLVPYHIIPVKNAATFQKWELQLKAILMTQNAWGILTGDLRKPMSFVVDSGRSGVWEIHEGYEGKKETYEKDLRGWKEKKELVLGWMMLTIGSDLRRKLEGAEDPVRVWKVLGEIYERKGDRLGRRPKHV